MNTQLAFVYFYLVNPVNPVERYSRQFHVGHVTLVPFIAAAGEMKTKPTQHSVRDLREIGIAPDILLCRSEKPIPRELRGKIALFCNVKESAVISAQDVDTIYDVPLAFHVWPP